MAAEALTSVLLEKLATGAIKQAGRVLGVRSDLMKLESALSAIQAVIHTAEERSVTERDVRDWVSKLKDAAYDADDLLDEFQTYAEWRNQDSSMSNKVRIFFSPRSNPLAFRIKMSFKIKAIVEKLDMIAQERTRYHLREDPRPETRHHQLEARMTAAVIDENNVYGRNDDVEEILKLLLEKEADKDEDLSVVTIIGMGGLGKTTLTQLVYNHERVVKQGSFDLRIWVYVSDKFGVKRIATAILESATGEKCDLSELAPIIDRVQQILRGKRFLLVLDDIWNENEEEWEKLRGFLAVGAKGSKILATTRSKKVATIMGTTSLYYLGVLSEDSCWRLFEKRAFKTEDIQREPFLEAIGREIVAKCGGSPLAAKSMGSLMRFKRGRGEWLAMRDSDVWRSTVEGNQVMASLRLSYNHLSPDLKQCFAYCCIFHKGARINRDALVLHWIALGFIPSNTILESAVSKGNEYFNNLVWISFLDKYFRPFYKMHDLVHDLAKSVAGEEQFSCYDEQKATNIPPRCRFCTLVGSWKEPELKHLFREPSKVRALRLECSVIIKTSILFTTLPCLRVLDMGDSPIKEVHASIDRLQHLRYFILHEGLGISELPNSIGRLRNLLALRAFDCDELRSLPESFGSLQNLRTLYLSGCIRLGSLPQSFTSLQNLQTLALSCCESLESLPETLESLQRLQLLKLDSCTTLVSLPQSIGKLANLRTLQLSACEALHALPLSLGNLANLEELGLEDCKDITELPEGMGNMANLRHLRNKGMSSLRGMPLGIGNMRSLVTLQLFVVGEGSNHSSIAEMRHLNLIEGELEVVHLENVKRLGDAARANMKEKHRLKGLYLRWSDLIPYDPYSIHEEVLADLIPHPNLEKLEIFGYPDINFPNWVRMMSTSVPNLMELRLYGLKCLPSFSGGLMQLKKLRLLEMPDVEEWLTVIAKVDLYPSLVRLEIKNCPKMHAEPCIPVSVKKLYLCDDVNYELLLPTRRAVEGVDLQDVSDAALEVLNINDSIKMVDLPESIRRFTSLQKLEISSCPNLARIPEWLRELTSLEYLTIYRCSSSLEERCKDTGEDWTIIAHIPYIDFRDSH